MKKILILSGVLLLSLTVNAQTFDYAKNGFSPLTKNDLSVGKQYDNLTLAKVTQVEQYIFGRSYPTQKLEKRLNNLEKTIFNRTYPTMSCGQRMDNIMVNYVNYVNNSAFEDLSKMEKSLFQRNYNNDMLENRIARLETRIFGTIQSGDLTSRYSRLQSIIPKYTTNTRTYSTQRVPQRYYYPKQQTGRQVLSGALGNLFNSGTLTGISPQIYSPYPDFEPDFHRGIQTRRGWYQRNGAIGSGSGVRILD